MILTSGGSIIENRKENALDSIRGMDDPSSSSSSVRCCIGNYVIPGEVAECQSFLGCCYHMLTADNVVGRDDRWID